MNHNMGWIFWSAGTVYYNAVLRKKFHSSKLFGRDAGALNAINYALHWVIVQYRLAIKNTTLWMAPNQTLPRTFV